MLFHRKELKASLMSRKQEDSKSARGPFPAKIKEINQMLDKIREEAEKPKEKIKT